MSSEEPATPQLDKLEEVRTRLEKARIDIENTQREIQETLSRVQAFSQQYATKKQELGNSIESAATEALQADEVEQLEAAENITHIQEEQQPTADVEIQADASENEEVMAGSSSET